MPIWRDRGFGMPWGSIPNRRASGRWSYSLVAGLLALAAVLSGFGAVTKAESLAEALFLWIVALVSGAFAFFSLAMARWSRMHPGQDLVWFRAKTR